MSNFAESLLYVTEIYRIVTKCCRNFANVDEKFCGSLPDFADQHSRDFADLYQISRDQHGPVELRDRERDDEALAAVVVDGFEQPDAPDLFKFCYGY